MDAILICLVVAISDGDTIKVRCGDVGSYSQETIRLSGIDAPEKAQAFGNRSQQSLAELCHKKTATIARKGTDRYNRTIGDVQCGGTDANAEQVRRGMAWVYDRYVKPDSHLYAIQNEAKSEGRGLWRDASPIPPWDWRRKQ